MFDYFWFYARKNHDESKNSSKACDGHSVRMSGRRYAPANAMSSDNFRRSQRHHSIWSCCRDLETAAHAFT